MTVRILCTDNLVSWSDTEAEFGESSVPWYSAIDFDIATHIVCPKCDKPLAYEGIQERDSKRSFAVCYACDLASEF